MPFVFITIGVVLLAAGVRGKSSDLFTLVKSDFSGQPNYFEWMVAIFLVGAVGYVKQLSTISRMFMFLVAGGLLYQNRQVFSEFNPEETAQPIQTPNATSTAAHPVTNGLPSLPSLQQDIDSFNLPAGLGLGDTFQQ